MMAFVEKSRTSFQDKLAKQNEINRQMLVRELSKLDETKKQDMRLLENAKQRFRSRYKRFGLGAVVSSGSKAIDVRMYETHNPGFCYHCNGAIKESGPVSSTPKTIVDPDESYEFVRSMLFTNGEVDVEKLLCLHVLAAYTTNSTYNQLPDARNPSRCLDRGLTDLSKTLDETERFTGAWNNILPCYVIDIKRNGNESTLEITPRQNNRRRTMENETPRDFELNYEINASNNANVVRTLNNEERTVKSWPGKLGKMPTISPHVYAILGASHESRIRRSMMENQDGGGRVTTSIVNRSGVDSWSHDGNDDSFNGEFRLFEDDRDTRDVTDQMIFRASAKNPESVATDSTITSANTTGNSLRSFRDFSLCGKIDRSITMLKGKPTGNFYNLGEDLYAKDMREDTPKNELVTIKSSRGTFRNSGSKSACKTKDGRRSRQDRDSFSSVSSWDSMIDSPRCKTIKYRNMVYLNSPIRSFALKNHEYHVVDILVNNQIEALVHSVLDVLDRINPEKVQRLLETARDIRKIRDIFGRTDIQNFVESLLDQPIVTSPKNFVVSQATAIDEIDSRLEDLIGGELVARTMELPASMCLESLVKDIRHNIFGIPENSDFTEFNDCDDDRIRNEEKKSFDEPNDEPAIDTARENDHQIGKKSRQARRVANECEEIEEKSIAKNFHKNHHRCRKNSEDEESSLDVWKFVNSSLRNEKNLLQSQEIKNEIDHLETDRTILRQMTNSQRKMWAALQNRRINNKGLIVEKTPLAAVISPVLSRECTKSLSRGTIRSKFAETMKNQEKNAEQTRAPSGKLTGPVLAKVQRDIAERETKRRLDLFLNVQQPRDS